MENKNLILLYIFVAYRSMSNIFSFMMGTCSGIYLAQNYDIPDIKIIGVRVLDYINSLEKKEEAKYKKEDSNKSH